MSGATKKLPEDYDSDSDHEAKADGAKPYEVGYGKPPKSGQFKKGESGNQSGRKKGSKSGGEALREIMAEIMTITENGQPKQVSRETALYLSVAASAMKGDAKARTLLFELMEKHGIDQPVTDQITKIEYVIVSPKEKKT